MKMKVILTIPLLALITSIFAAPTTNPPFNSHPVLVERDDWRFKLEPIEAFELELKATDFAHFEHSMCQKYPVHYCATFTGDCDRHCAFSFGMSSSQALTFGDCMSKDDLATYHAKQKAVQDLEQKLADKYDSEAKE